MARLGDRIGRWIRQTPSGQRLGAWLGAAYIRLVNATTRWQIIGVEHFHNALPARTGIIATAWHGRLFMSPLWVPHDRRTVAMISNNRDGDLISAIVQRFGVSSVRGSSYDHEKRRDKGGAEAYAGAHQELSAGSVVAITPDGPRGPRMRAQRGAALLSIQTGAQVQPITFATVRGKTLRNWDRFLFPWPFGRGVQIYGPALNPPGTDDAAAVDRYVAEIEAALTEITNRADEMCGRSLVEPGPPIDRG